MLTSPLDTPRAACLTPPTAGGVAVVQVVGHSAPALVAPLLQSKRPLNLEVMDKGELRLCRLMDGHERLDDCLVCVRRCGPVFVVDISVHGGPRIVQRVLLLLRRAGAQIVEPVSLFDAAFLAENPIARDTMPALLGAKTRPVAAWLVRNAELFTAELHRIVAFIDAGQSAAARDALRVLLAAAPRIRLLLEGIRIVLSGPPNVGKSTLANTLAAREHAIVSDVPGTTRDFVEIPAAIGGVPVTFVDTAGVRETTDPVEQEAIRRTLHQTANADLVLQLADAAAYGTHLAPAHFHGLASPEAADNTPARVLLVWTKADRFSGPMPQAENGMARPLLISAHTGQGLEHLRTRLLDAFGLTDWSRLVGPWSRTLTEALQAVLDASSENRPAERRAREKLAALIEK